MAVVSQFSGWVRTVLRRQRVANFVMAYEDFIGLTDVKVSQQKVLQAQEKFEATQEERRARQLKISAVQAELRLLRDEIDKTHRTDDRYLKLVMQEHSLIKEERKLMDEFQFHEKAERDYFSALSLAVRDSQEKERAQAEKSKYLSVIGSICGAVIGIVGTSINNRARMRELRRLMTEGPVEHHYKIRSDLEDSLAKQESALTEFLNSLRADRGSSCDHECIVDQTKHLIALLEKSRSEIKTVLPGIDYANETRQALKSLTFLSSIAVVLGLVALVVNYSKS